MIHTFETVDKTVTEVIDPWLNGQTLGGGGASCCLGRLAGRPLCHRGKREEANKRRRLNRKEKSAEAEERNAAGGAEQITSGPVSALKAQMRSFKWLLCPSLYHMQMPPATKPPATLKTLFTRGHEVIMCEVRGGFFCFKCPAVFLHISSQIPCQTELQL